MTASPSSELGTPRKKCVLIIDDVANILDAAVERLRYLVGEDFAVESFHYDVSGIYMEWSESTDKAKLPSWTSKDEELEKVLRQKKPDFILMDWGYSVKVRGGAKEDSPWYSLSTPVASGLGRNAHGLLFGKKVTDEVRKDKKDRQDKDEGHKDKGDKHDMIGIVGQYMRDLPQVQRPDVLVYTFNPFENDVFETMARTQDKFVKEIAEPSDKKDANTEGPKPSFQYIETSAFFNHPRPLSIYKGWYETETGTDKKDGLKEIGTTQQLREYGTLLATIFKDYLHERVANLGSSLAREKRIFNLENLRFVRYKRFVSDRLGLIQYMGASGTRTEIPLKLGALTYFDGGGKILLDIPRKDYYEALDGWADEARFKDLLFRDMTKPANEGWQVGAKNYLYIRLFVKPVGSGSAQRLELAIAAQHSNISKLSEDRLKQLTSLIFSSIYYYCAKKDDDEKGTWMPAATKVEILEGVALRDWRKVNQGERELEPIDVFFLCQQVETDAGKSGWVNYSLYNDTRDIGNFQVKEIERIVDRILFDIRPAIIAKAKDALLPQLYSAVKREAMRAGVARVSGRSAAHNVGSNGLQRLTRPNALSKALGGTLLGKDPLQSLNMGVEPQLRELLSKALAMLDPSKPDMVSARKVIEEVKSLLIKKALVSALAEEEIRKLFSYVKDRMELIAQISTSRSGLSESRRMVDLVREFDRHKLLTHHMVTEGFAVERVKCTISELVNVPEGPLGASAFFNVLECILRNDNRHGERKACALKVTAVPEGKTKWVKVTISHEWEPRGDPTKTPQENRDIALGHINEALDKNMLDEKGAVRRGGWGLLELKLACMFLRDGDLAMVDEKDAVHPLLSAECNEVKGKHRLVFTFFMLRPRTYVQVVPGTANSKFKSTYGGVDEVDVPSFPIAVIPAQADVEALKLDLPTRVVRAATDGLSEAGIWKEYWSQHFPGHAVRIVHCNHGIEEGSVMAGDGEPALKGIFHQHPPPASAISAPAVKEVVLGVAPPHVCEAMKADINSTPPGVWVYRLAEAAATSVVVLDERIQQAAEEGAPIGIMHGTLMEQLTGMGIFIPRKTLDVDLNEPDHGNLVGYLKGLLATPLLANSRSRYIVIHRTVLQKLQAKTNTKDFKDYVGMYFGEFNTCWTSGASSGDAVVDLDLPFVPFAMLERSTIGTPCKWLLTDMVVCARPDPNP